MATVVQHQQHPPPNQHHSHLPQSPLNPVLSSHISPPLPLPAIHPRPNSNPAPLPTPPPGAPTAAASTSPHAPTNQHTNVLAHLHQSAPSSSKAAVSEGREREQDSTAAGSGSADTSDKKRPRILMEAASIVPADDRNEWYYPAAPRPAALADSEDEPDLDPAASTGNWGNKLVKGARWVRRGKMTSWGPSRAEWEMENRARKRLKSLLPDQSIPSSPPLPTLPHLRSPTPPLNAPYALPPKTHTSYTSFLVDPSVQHSYTTSTVTSLQRTATEFIEGEGTLRIALGALWQAFAVDYTLPSSKTDASGHSARQSVDAVESLSQSKDMNVGRIAVANGAEGADVRMGSPSSASTLPTRPPGELVSSLDSLRQLFISSTPIVVGQEGAPQATITTESQIDSFEWAVGMLRDLTGDTREYMERLEEVRELSGLASAAKAEVWNIIKEKALEEMEDGDSQGEDDDGDEGSEY